MRRREKRGEEERKKERKKRVCHLGLFVLTESIFCKKISFAYIKFIQIKCSHTIFINYN